MYRSGEALSKEDTDAQYAVISFNIYSRATKLSGHARYQVPIGTIVAWYGYSSANGASYSPKYLDRVALWPCPRSSIAPNITQRYQDCTRAGLKMIISWFASSHWNAVTDAQAPQFCYHRKTLEAWHRYLLSELFRNACTLPVFSARTHAVGPRRRQLDHSLKDVRKPVLLPRSCSDVQGWQNSVFFTTLTCSTISWFILRAHLSGL